MATKSIYSTVLSDVANRSDPNRPADTLPKPTPDSPFWERRDMVMGFASLAYVFRMTEAALRKLIKSGEVKIRPVAARGSTLIYDIYEARAARQELKREAFQRRDITKFVYGGEQLADILMMTHGSLRNALTRGTLDIKPVRMEGRESVYCLEQALALRQERLRKQGLPV